MVDLYLITDASYGFETQGAVYGLQTATEKMNVIVQIALLHVTVHSPDTIQKHGTGKGLAGISEKYLQKCPLPL